MEHHHLSSSFPFSKSLTSPSSERNKAMLDRAGDILSSLSWIEDACTFMPLHLHAGYFLPLPLLNVLNDDSLTVKPTDIILATIPKSGTTWLKAILFATLNRHTNPPDDHCHPLLSLNPHQCVPFLEYNIYIGKRVIDLDTLPSPRLLATHLPFPLLPRHPHSKLIYLARNPKDVFVSLFHFSNKVRLRNGGEPLDLDRALDHFSSGVSLCGPYWDHVLDYWNTSLTQPDTVLFIKYEDLKRDAAGELRRMAEFAGCEFSEEEERGCVVEEIVRLCSFGSLSKLEVNVSGSTRVVSDGRNYDNASFFRRGEVGDWVNCLTPEMAERLDKITEAKFAGSGLSF